MDQSRPGDGAVSRPRTEGRRGGRRFQQGALALLVFAIALDGSCTPRTPARDAAGEEPPLEAEEVGPAPDAAHDPSTDTQERRHGTSVLGVLPGDYPPDLPIPPASSLVDYGDRDDGSRFVELHTTAPAEAVHGELQAAWVAAGWQRQGESYTKADVTASLTVEARSRTLTRVEIGWRRAP